MVLSVSDKNISYLLCIRISLGPVLSSEKLLIFAFYQKIRYDVKYQICEHAGIFFDTTTNAQWKTQN